MRHKFCSPHVKHKPRFLPSQNKTIFAVGSVATKAFHRVSLPPPPSPPPPPLATDGENVIPIAEGLRPQKRRMEEVRAADGRSPRSPNPVTVRQSVHSVSSAAISRRMKGREAKSRVHDCRSSQPRPPVTKASLLQRGVVGTQMQPHSARWACTNHGAAMTKAARAFQVLQEAVLRVFCVSSPLNDALHSDHPPPPLFCPMR